MLFAKVLRSPFPHARIKKITTDEAEQMPGVIKVVTGQDIPYGPYGRLVFSIGPINRKCQS